MNPLTVFVFTEANLKKVVDLLLNLKSAAMDISGRSSYFLFDVLASAIIEALKFAQVIPRSHENELTRVAREIAHCNKLKAILEKYVSAHS